jgi:hypothetical protein
MEKKHVGKKRPCRICRKWFIPDPRLGVRQHTCGAEACQKEWHRKKCAEWNRKNRSYFKEIYLRGRLESFGTDPPESTPVVASAVYVNKPPRQSFPPDFPQSAVQEVIGMKQLIIIEYITRLLLRGFSRGDQGKTG